MGAYNGQWLPSVGKEWFLEDLKKFPKHVLEDYFSSVGKLKTSLACVNYLSLGTQMELGKDYLAKIKLR